MIYYIEDYQYQKHDLLIEEGDNTQKTGKWLDMPQLTLYENNVIKAGYSISLVNEDVTIVTFFNDVILQAKDGHRLSVEEITIFILLLMSETILQATDYLINNYNGEQLIDTPNATPETIMDFVKDKINALN
jgi:hypothetical protein